MKLKVDPDLCISSGRCLRTAPDAFAWNAFGIAEVVDPSAASEEDLQVAVLECPIGAISIEEDDDGDE